ncbi:MAG: HD domain-containing protein [Oscillospiraceae bacterium]|nr:HD domain-containing protein [Oscillospiraceae bacterium]
MNDYPKLSETEIGKSIERPLLVSAIAEGVSKNGKPYLRVTFKDGFSDETAMMFDTSAAQLDAMGIRKNEVAYVKIAVSEYQGNRSLKINEIVPNKDPSVTISDFVKVPPVDLDLMYNEICELVKSVADDMHGRYEPLSELTLRILEEHKAGYMTSSAAVSMHHDLRGGLLYHSYRMAKAADALCGVYDTLDRELLICGAVLHDIGKLWEYRTEPSGDAEFTRSGVLFGHLYLGASLIKKYTDDHNYNMEKVQLLIHLILSHHGTQEWGAVACPAVSEAFVLHYIDNIDAKLYMCEEFCANMEPGQMTEKRPFGLDNKIYRPEYKG